MDCKSNIIISPGKLIRTFGDNYKRYAYLMKKWFTKKITKDEYDDELRLFLTPSQIKFHNKFILSVLSKCSNSVLNPSSVILSEIEIEPALKRIKLEETNAVFKSLPKTDPHDYLKQTTAKSLHEELISKGFLIFLPDQDAIYARMMLHAWEHDLENVEDAACKLIIDATYAFARNILTVTISRRTGFRTKDKEFIHDLGTPAVNPWLRNTIKYTPNDKCVPTEIVDNEEIIHVPKPIPAVSEVENSIAFELALSSRNGRKARMLPIRVDDVIDALKVYPYLVPRYLMYSINMERFLLAKHHSSWKDLNN